MGTTPLLLLLLIPFISKGLEQPKLGIEHYQYWSAISKTSMVPVVNFTTKKKGYAECRYNYEEVNSFSVFGGKIIEGGKDFQYRFIPMLGISAGDFAGVSVATKTHIEWQRFFLSAEMQYSASFQNKRSNFIFNWSELGYGVSDFFFCGVSMQYLITDKSGNVEPGLMAGVNYKKITFPLYVFSPFKNSRYFVLGVNFAFTINK
jgi:hypothetical protein